MKENQHPILKNPPIVEAIIDIRVSPVVAIDENKIFEIVSSMGTQYQSIAPLPMRDFKFTVRQASLERTETTRGYIIQSLDGVNKSQFRIDGFTFNRLPPYTNWEEINQDAKTLWNLYKTKFSPKQISRIAVRYINQMQFDTDIEGIGQYLTTPPKLHEKFELTTKSVFMRATIEDVDKQMAATITQEINQNDSIGITVVILDIDAFSLRKFSIANEEMIWKNFEQLREMKNDIFYRSVTQSAIEFFNK
jgi:uncharacterized protein (TIGR04255 family)